MFVYINSNLGQILNWMELTAFILAPIIFCYRWLKKTPSQTKLKMAETTFRIIPFIFLLLLGVLTIFLVFQIEDAQKNHNELIQTHQALLADLSDQSSVNISTLLISQNEELHQSSSKIMKMVLQEGRLAFWFIVYAFGFAVITASKTRSLETEFDNRIKELESWIKSDIQ